MPPERTESPNVEAPEAPKHPEVTQPPTQIPQPPTEDVPAAQLRRRQALVRRNDGLSRPGSDNAVQRPRRLSPLRAHDVPLQPDEVLGAPVVLGRDTSVRTVQGRHRSNYDFFSTLGAGTLRSQQGWVHRRLVGHAFSLAGEGCSGSFLVETLREISSKLLHYVSGARDLPPAAVEQLQPLLQPMVQALGWAGDLVEGKKPLQVLASHILGSLAVQKRVLIPAELMGREADVAHLEGAGVVEAHAMLIELQRNDQGLIDLRLYNTGRGIGTWHLFVPKRAGETLPRFAPAFVVRDINLDDGALHTMLVALLAARRDTSESLDAAIDHLYERISQLGRVETVLHQPSCKPQMADNCTWKCVTSFVQSSCDPVTYRRFKVYLRSRILEDAARDLVAVNGDRKIAQGPAAWGREPEGGVTLSSDPSLEEMLWHGQRKVYADLIKLHTALREAGDFDGAAALLAHMRRASSGDQRRSSRDNFDVCAFVRAEREEIARTVTAMGWVEPEGLTPQPV